MPDEIGFLVIAAARGDGAAWDALVTRFGRKLWYDAYAYAGNVADAEDVIQAAWLRLLEHLGRIREPTRVGAWLSTTVRREADALRRRRNSEHLCHTPPELDVADDPAEAVIHADRARRLWQRVDAMSEPCRTLIRLLAHGPPHTYADIAQRMGMPVGSVGPNRTRCLGRLRDLLESETP